jgi:hypothetical protein
MNRATDGRRGVFFGRRAAWTAAAFPDSPLARARPACACGLAAVLCTALALPCAVAAQGVRGTATTTGRVIEFRPLTTDTIDPSLLETDTDGTVRLDGRAIDCRPDIPCILYRPSSREAGSTISQDVRL